MTLQFKASSDSVGFYSKKEMTVQLSV